MFRELLKPGIRHAPAIVAVLGLACAGPGAYHVVPVKAPLLSDIASGESLTVEMKVPTEQVRALLQSPPSTVLYDRARGDSDLEEPVWFGPYYGSHTQWKRNRDQRFDPWVRLQEADGVIEALLRDEDGQTRELGAESGAIDTVWALPELPPRPGDGVHLVPSSTDKWEPLAPHASSHSAVMFRRGALLTLVVEGFTAGTLKLDDGRTLREFVYLPVVDTIDLASFVDGDPAGYRVLLDRSEVKGGLLMDSIWVLPWTDDALDPARPGYRLEFRVFNRYTGYLVSGKWLELRYQVARVRFES